MRPFTAALSAYLSAESEALPASLFRVYELAPVSKDAGTFRVWDMIQTELRAAQEAGVDTAGLETLSSVAKAMLRGQVARAA